MRPWLRSVEFVTLFVEDLPRSRAFYADVFGLAAVYEDENSAVFDFGNVSVNLLTTTAAHELLEPGAVSDRGSGSRFQLTLPVEDVDAVCAELALRGVALLNGPLDRPWGIRTASFVDPGGHVWEIAQPLAQPPGSGS